MVQISLVSIFPENCLNLTTNSLPYYNLIGILWVKCTTCYLNPQLRYLQLNCLFSLMAVLTVSQNIYFTGICVRIIIKQLAVKILNTRTDCSEPTLQTQIRLLLKRRLFWIHLLHGRANLFHFKTITVVIQFKMSLFFFFFFYCTFLCLWNSFYWSHNVFRMSF